MPSKDLGLDLGLEPEQVELLATITEAHRAVPREERQTFVARRYPYKPGGPAELRHPGLPDGRIPMGQVLMADVRALERAGLISITQSRGSLLGFELTPAGLRYHVHLTRSQGEPAARVGAEVRRYIDAEPFRSAYPSAYQKWLQAEDLLWGDDSEANLTAIGHHCREAMQEFADALVREHRPEGVSADRAKTVERIRAVVRQRVDSG